MAEPTAAGVPNSLVVVGASLAGLRAAEHARRMGYSGSLVVVGDEKLPPYDRTPLSKAMLHRRSALSGFRLTQSEDLSVNWMLGSAAVSLDPTSRRVMLADGSSLDYDRLVIATGRRARPWPDSREAGLDGVLTLRTLDDGDALRQRLLASGGPLVIIGSGFIGSEVASAARQLGVAVTVVSRGRSPLDGALGHTVGSVIARLYRDNGVSLRLGLSVTALLSDDATHVSGVQLSDGTVLPAETVLVATGTLANVEWLEGSGLDSAQGVAVDGDLRALTLNGTPSPDICAAGDVTRWTAAAAGNPLVATEHWGNAVVQGRQAVETLLASSFPHQDSPGGGRQEAQHAEHSAALPSFWSTMFGVTIKSVGVASFGDEIMVAQGSLEQAHGVVLYGRHGRVVAAVTMDAPRDMPFYASLVARGAPFPPDLGIPAKNRPESTEPRPAQFPARSAAIPAGSAADTTLAALSAETSRP